MSPSSPQHEPTMEEILASIRKIISEESPDGQSAPSPVQAKPAAQEADVLDLTEEVHDEPAPANVEPQPEPVAETVVQLPSQEESPVSSAAQVQALPSGDGIFSDKTRKALNDAFTSVEPEPEVRAAPTPSAAPVAPVNGSTIESVFDRAIRETFDPVLHGFLEQNKDVIVERMKPVVTQWLDDHFPAMLEEAVREELARVSKTRVKR